MKLLNVKQLVRNRPWDDAYGSDKVQYWLFETSNVLDFNFSEILQVITNDIVDEYNELTKR